MDIKQVNLSLEYQVDRANVKLVVESGDISLLSASSFALEGREKRWRLKEDESKLEIDLGSGSELKGKRMRGLSTVADLIGAPNMTRINYTLSGGLGTQRFDAELPVNQEMDVVLYFVQIKFI